MPAGRTPSIDICYRGRFAPTPSGPLHLGSLLTALASWLDARAAQGLWMLRIDDLDGPRCDPRHTDTILRQLEAHGLHWDGAPRVQSRHRANYRDALQALRRSGRLFACDCTRRRLRDAPLRGPLGPIYPGRCRDRTLPPDARAALRLRVPDGSTSVHDDWRGEQTWDWQRELGDFILWRSDDLPGYALSCAVDEHAMAITHVVRGGDLLAMTAQHQEVLRALGWAAPRWRHGPLLCHADGRKLSKQNRADPLDTRRAVAHLRRCCALLGLHSTAIDAAGSVPELLPAALATWRELERPPTGALEGL